MLITNESALLEYLDANGIAYTRVEHPPVFTCAEAALFRGKSTGLETKNLFLRGESRAGEEPRFYLLMTACEKRLDLRVVGREVGQKKLHFASEAQLMDALGLTPGAVTVLALVNDPAHRVSLLVDAEYWPSAEYLCHPLVNTATLVLDHENLMKFFGLTGHEVRVIHMQGAG